MMLSTQTIVIFLLVQALRLAYTEQFLADLGLEQPHLQRQRDYRVWLACHSTSGSACTGHPSGDPYLRRTAGARRYYTSPRGKQTICLRVSYGRLPRSRVIRLMYLVIKAVSSIRLLHVYADKISAFVRGEILLYAGIKTFGCIRRYLFGLFVSGGGDVWDSVLQTRAHSGR